jgi:hypothetical protein
MKTTITKVSISQTGNTWLIVSFIEGDFVSGGMVQLAAGADANKYVVGSEHTIPLHCIRRFSA